MGEMCDQRISRNVKGRDISVAAADDGGDTKECLSTVTASGVAILPWLVLFACLMERCSSIKKTRRDVFFFVLLFFGLVGEWIYELVFVVQNGGAQARVKK